jgi:hypothetical protein
MTLDKLRTKYPTIKGLWKMADLFGVDTPKGVRWYTLEDGEYEYAAKSTLPRGRFQLFEGV